jgi:hypothetical protein
MLKKLRNFWRRVRFADGYDYAAGELLRRRKDTFELVREAFDPFGNAFSEGILAACTDWKLAQANQIMDWRAHADMLASKLAKVTGFLASVRTDRKQIQDGVEFALQTMDWANGALEEAEAANQALEKHDEEMSAAR